MKCNRWDFPFITENIVAMVRVTQPTNEEIGYQYQVALQHWSKDLFKRICNISSSISEDADYIQYGITGTLPIIGGVPKLN